MSFSFPTFQPSNEVGYHIGTFGQYVPPFQADTVMIRPFGEYGMDTAGYATRLNGAYWINAQSTIADPTIPGTDLVYLVQKDLKLLPKVNKVVIAVHWYTSNDQGNVANGQIVPAIGPEVVAWNWQPNQGPSQEWICNPWTRANAYWLKATHQVWPTPDDNALIRGIEFLQSQGYEVGICPIATLMSNNFYFAGGGEWEIDRSLLKWTNLSALTNYLAGYQVMYKHYIDLLSAANLRPWIFYLGYGMRDITCSGNSQFIIQFINTVSSLALYCKQKLPNTLTTYAADLDEYYYPYLVTFSLCYLDPLWTCPNLDFVGINWFAPLVLDNSENNQLLEQGVLQGEGDTFYLPGFAWRGTTTDRFISTTTQNFKTGLTKSSISPLTSGVKDIIDWLAFYHYYPAINGVLAGCSPLPNIFPGDPRLCSQFHGLGPVGSTTTLSPTVGGLAPVPGATDTWVQVQLHSYMYVTFPQSVPDDSTFAFDFSFAIDPTLTDLTGNYRLFDSSFGLKLDSIAGTITLWVRTLDGSYQSVPLFSAPKGEVSLVYTPSSIKILVDGAYDLTITPLGTSRFRMPTVLDTMWFGNPQTAGVIPAGYGVWQGKLYYLSIVLGVGVNQSGGQFFFDDAYAGIRTAWTPGLKPWMATSFGYGSVQGSAADPQTRAQTILANTTVTRIPDWYEDFQNVTGANYLNGFKVWDIEGPYGSTFNPDQDYQAIVMNAAALGLLDAGAVHQVAWFFDTRSPGAYLALMPNGDQQFNDAYDTEINSMLNGKSSVRLGGTTDIIIAQTTVDEDLGLSIVPGPLPPERTILVQPNVPQV